jgi:seryl-tRNA synthetase
MLDIKLIVERTDFVKEGLLKRMSSEEFDLEGIIEIHKKLKAKRLEFEESRSKQKSFNEEMAKLEKGSDAFKKAVLELKDLASEVKQKEVEARELEEDLKQKLEVLPNIPETDVPAGGKEGNVVVKEVGKKKDFDFKIKDHVELTENLGLVDFERAAKLAGSQFSMYVGDGARLEWALINFFVEEHLNDGYEMIMPPHLLVEESAYTAGQLPKFRDDVYWVQDGNCLLPTAETALANIYRGEILNESDLPKKFFAYTPCYRREAGSYRANERGLMRTHQFNKVEMFQYTTQDQSKDALEELVQKACSLVEKLGLHYRVSKLAAGDCSAPAATTYDVEVWIPAIEQYYEVSSISNVKDYQARRGNIRYKTESGTEFVHMLNASGLATSRLLVSILETYQNADGTVDVPEVLQKYLGGKKVLTKI